MAEPSVIIIGAGTFGTSTAYHLSHAYKDPSRVTVIDLAPSPPKQAAAIDVNRIIRTDYPTSLYCNLANEAIYAWFWSLDLQRYFHKTGWIMIDDTDETNSLSSRVRATFKARGADPTHGIPLEELSQEWDVLQATETRGFHTAYFNPEAGWCDAALATDNLMKAAEKRGVRRVTARVTELMVDADLERVSGVRTADGETYSADTIVLAAGAWTSSLLSPVEDLLDIPDEDRIERQMQAVGRVAAYYTMSEEDVERCAKSKLPVICYGLKGEAIPPSRTNKTFTYRNSETSFTNTLTTDSGKTISAPRSQHAVDQTSVPESLKQALHDIVSSKVAPHFASPARLDHWRICWDAVTPTEDWLMCRHPHTRLQNLYLAVGGSFHSYKFLPNAGKYMLNVLQGKTNGREKDAAWGWKHVSDTGCSADKKVNEPLRELQSYESPGVPQESRSRL
ncbi:hypothetical protein LTR53_009037 [Teratosphaeriaceae sp. CCFEE 6253]|nr:hypothetical protein LTR53_009037 [Teratosphaeriaceae sp. CCFEE 6253]